MSPPDIALVLLAAGRSTRFGSDKLRHPIGGAPLGLRAAGMLAGMGFARSIAVCRAPDGPLPDALRMLGYEIAVSGKANGMGDSLAIGAAQAAAGAPGAILIALADMPFVSRGHIAALIAALRDSASGAAASRATGVAGPPAIFDKRHFAALMGAAGDSGARRLLADAPLVTGAPEMLRDIDRPGDVPSKEL